MKPAGLVHGDSVGVRLGRQAGHAADEDIQVTAIRHCNR